MTCPIGNNSGLITLTGGIATLQLQSISPGENTLPFELLTFPTRSTPPTSRGTFIDEVNPEKNICTVDGNRGILVGIQICTTTHTGYRLPGNTRTPVAELILSFHVKTRAAGSAVYHGILLCLPIYDAIPSQQHHHEYLTAIMTGSMTADASTIPSLSSLFYSSKRDTSQVSLSYKTCVEVKEAQAAQTFSTKSLAVFVFPHGIHIASNILQPFLAQKVPQKFRLPSLIREDKATAKSYRFNNGVKEITETSSEGVLYTTTINSCNDEFKGKIQYFVRPPPIPSVSSSSTTTTKLTTSQYKCVPFDKLKNVEAGERVNLTLKDVINTQERFRIGQDATRTTGLSPEQMEAIIAGSIIGVGVIAWVIYAVHYRTST